MSRIPAGSDDHRYDGDKWPRHVRGVEGTSYELSTGKALGSGGEGTVFRTTNDRFAVKLCTSANDSEDDLRRRLERLRWLPLEGVPISRPDELLAAPDLGYAMELLDDMVAISTLGQPPEGDLDRWYASGGGLRRRLRLLARCADVLSLLHSRGIVYSDISPGNILVSSCADYEELWLIDADNLQMESSTTERRLMTELYAAPELIRGRTGNTVWSDVYSFAIIAYETLAADHPLIGELVANDYELERDVQLGMLPWTGHSTNDENRSEHGIGADRVLTRRLRSLFTRNFEDGLFEPMLRPSAGRWANALHDAAAQTVICTECRQSFYVAREHCSWCRQPRPEVLVIALGERFPPLTGGRQPLDETLGVHLILQAGAEFAVTLTARTAFPGVEAPDAPVARFEWGGGEQLIVRNTGSEPLTWIPPRGGDGRQLLPGSQVAGTVGEGWTVHFGPDRNRHRFAEVLVVESGGDR